jgi:hypothetical protein
MYTKFKALWRWVIQGPEMNRLESFESLLSDPTNVHILDTTFISLIHKPGLREEEKMCLDLKEIGGIDV